MWHDVFDYCVLEVYTMSKMLIFGDICPTKDTMDLFSSGELEIISEEIRKEVESAAFVLGNLECVLSNRPTPIMKAGPVLYASVKTAALLKKIGFDAVSLANNHIRDCGDEGVKTTITACKDNRICCFGAAGTEAEAKKPYIVVVGGKRIGFYAVAEREFNYVRKGRWGANAFDAYDSFDDIGILKQQVDYLVVLYHGGIEYYAYPSPMLRKKCRKMVDCGANLVLCQHSHCIGSKEQYKNGEILYGQGNSVFGFRNDNDIWNYGLLVDLEISDDVRITYRLMETLSDGKVCLSENKKPYNDFMSRSFMLDDEEFLVKEWHKFCEKKKALYMPLLYGLSTNTNRFNRLLQNKLVDWFYSRKQKNVTHNLIRCDAHREVVDTLLSVDDFE